MLFGEFKKEKELTIGHFTIKELAEKYGTPLFVGDEIGFKENLELYKNSFQSEKFESQIAYASKAFSCQYILRILKNENYFLDVVSLGELATALAVDFPMERVLFHGNNKSDLELREAITRGIGLIVVDHFVELEVLGDLLDELETTQDILIRINPGLETSTHEYIQTSRPDSKFGIFIEDERLLEELKNLHPRIQLRGFHSHIGSQIFEKESFYKNIEIMFELTKKVEDLGFSLDTCNLGGGFGSYYKKGDPIPNQEDFLREYAKKIEENLEKFELNLDYVMIEPGRSLINNYMITVYEIGAIKEAVDKNYIFIDGGMGDNLRPALYDAEYEGILVEERDSYEKTFTIAGKYCESGDLLIENLVLPTPKRGDLFAILQTGAYTYSMFSQYNKVLRPAVVFVGEEDQLAIKRQTIEELLEGEL